MQPWMSNPSLNGFAVRFGLDVILFFMLLYTKNRNSGYKKTDFLNRFNILDKFIHSF